MVIIFISLQSSIFSAQPALAVNNETIPSVPLFCASINSIGTRIESQLTNITQSSVPALYSPTNLTSRQAAIQQELKQKRTEWDNERNQQYDKMLSLAQNEAQKTAIETFRSSVEDAILVRRNSVDGAIDTYFSQTGGELQAESNQLTAAKEDFITAIKSAINTAKSECLTGKSPSDIRSTFQTNIETARTQLQTSRQRVGEFKSSLETIHKQEVKSINEAVRSFQDSLSKARQTLIDDLKKSGANTSQYAI